MHIDSSQIESAILGSLVLVDSAVTDTHRLAVFIVADGRGELKPRSGEAEHGLGSCTSSTSNPHDHKSESPAVSTRKNRDHHSHTSVRDMIGLTARAFQTPAFKAAHRGVTSKLRC